jgi:hypothetical protein
MDKTTTLHIGTTKTGSTSIQSCLAGNRAVLAGNGVLYPKTLGLINHNVIPVYLQCKQINSQLQTKFDIKTEAHYAAFAETRPSLFAAEIADHDPAHIIISSEHMHSRCYTPEQFARIKNLLTPALTGRMLRIVVYLRPQISHVVSLYSTMLRHGATDTVDDFIISKMTGRGHAYFDFRKLLTKWAAAFPQATFVVRPFGEVKNLPHGVLSDFLEIENLTQFADEMTFEPRQNESMGAWTAEVLRQLNMLEPPLPAKLDRSVRHWLRRDMPVGRVIPNIKIARAFQKSFAKSNAWVCKTYFNGNTSAFDVDWSKYAPAADQQGIGPSQFLELVRNIAK